MKRRDLLSSLVWMGLGALFIVGSLQQGLMRKGVPGPGFLPFITGIALIVLSLFVFVPAICRREGGDQRIPFFPERDSLKKLALALIALFAYCYALMQVGYVLTTFVFMAFMARIMEPRAWATSLLVAFLTTAATYFLFMVLLEVQLPRGLIGF